MPAENTRTCPICATTIPAGFPEGLCPKCMLAQAAPTNSVQDVTLPVAAPVPSQASPRPCGVPSVEALCDLFPDLDILDLLGAGGMGAVYKARQPRLNRLVALKIMVGTPGHEVDFALRFEREAQVLARLNHPHIVIIYDFGDISPERTGGDPLFWFLMEYVDGTDLGQLIKSKELRAAQALAIVPQICEALQYAHDQGITHRDIKPANILIDKRGTVKIADFGLAKMVGGDAADAMMTGLTQTGTAMGTPHYMAPEQWDHPELVDHRADIYALGVVFYEMLTGERPAGVFQPPSKKTTPPVDKKLDGVVLRAMEKDPGRRYQQAGQIGDDVTRITGANKRKPATTGAPETQRNPLKPLLALGTAAALGIGGWMLWPEEEDRKITLSSSLPVASSSKPGRLRAAGVDIKGQAHDLSRFAAYSDFVDVTGGRDKWVALRATGETVSYDGKSDLKNIRKIVKAASITNDYAFITTAGKLIFRDGSSNVAPAALEKAAVVDAVLGSDHGLALTDVGLVVPFGLRYEKVCDDPDDPQRWGTPRWPQPPPQAVQNVKAVAATTTHAASLHHDGTVSIWGWEGLVKWTPDPRQKPFKTIAPSNDSLWILDDAGQVWQLWLPRNPSPNQPVGTPGKCQLVETHPASHVGSSHWRRASGEWCAADTSSNWIFKQNPLGPDTVFSLATGAFPQKGQASLLWIEPVAEGRAAGHPAAAPSNTALGEPNALPGANTLPPFTDREAAEWALKYMSGINTTLGGAVTGVRVRVGNLPEKHIKTSGELPKEPFTVTAIHCMPPDEQKGDAAIQGRTTDADVTRFVGLKGVKELYLHGQLTGRSLAAVMQIPALEVLTLSSAQLEPADLVALKGSKLRELGFLDFRLRDAASLEVLRTMPALRLLAFTGGADPALFAALPSLPDLQRLRINFSPGVTDEALPLITKRFPALEEVNLARCRNLRGTQLGALKSLPKLGLIDVIDTQVDDAALAALQGMKLPRLKASYTRVTDAAVPLLAAMPLIELDIGDTALTDAGILKLAAIPTLQRLALNGYRRASFTPAGVAAVQKQRPGLDVSSVWLMAGASDPPPAATVPPNTNLGGPSALPKHEWVKVDWPGQTVRPGGKPTRKVSEEEITKEGGLRLLKDDLWIGDQVPRIGKVQNGGIRLHWKRLSEKAAAGSFNVFLRGDRKAKVSLLGGGATIFHGGGGDASRLKGLPHGGMAPVGQEMLMEIACVGRLLILKRDGVVYGTQELPEAAPADYLRLQGSEVIVTQAELINLDHLSEADALKVLGVDSAVPTIATAVRYPVRTPDGRITFPVGFWAWMRPDEPEVNFSNRPAKRDGDWMLGSQPAWSADVDHKVVHLTNVGVRARFRGQRVSQSDYPQINLRGSNAKPVAVNLHIVEGRMLQIRGGAPKHTVIAQVPLSQPLAPGQEFTMEFYAIGTRLIGRVNSQTLMADTTATEVGNVSLYRANNDFFKDVQVLNLDGLSEAEALKLAGLDGVGPSTSATRTATKATPFVNSLGMKFVPVPITGGPSNGQRVLFSIWETRVQDFEAFLQATGRTWPKPVDVEQGPNHPAANVCWTEGTAFCAWLTERERQAGRLGANESYRLPTDHEWSCAVGIGQQEDAAKLPEEKNMKLADVFPWGTQLPPPEKSSNYWSEELRPLQAAGKFSSITGELSGYRDGFATTAPVGSYPANRFGLHDIEGNLREWCEDWFDAQHTSRALRGGSFISNNRDRLLSSLRSNLVPGGRSDFHGFRIVLADASSGLSTAAVPPQAALGGPSALPQSPFPLPRPHRPAKGAKVTAWHYRDGPIAQPSGVMELPPALDDVVALEVSHIFGDALPEKRGTHQHALALRVDGRIIAWGRDEHGETKVPDGLKPAVGIATGQRFSLALHEDGTVTGWGFGHNMIYNSVSSWKNIVAIDAGRAHLLGLTSDGRILVSGENNEGQTAVPADIQGHVRRVATLENTSAALLDDTTVRVWGEVKKVDLASVKQARGVAGLFIAKGRVFTTDGTGKLSAHLLPGDALTLPRDIRDLSAITSFTTSHGAHPFLGVFSGITKRWHFWGNKDWESPAVQKNLEAAGNPGRLVILSPDHLIGFSQAGAPVSFTPSLPVSPSSPPFTDREAAEWMLGLGNAGCYVQIKVGNKPDLTVRSISELPNESFVVVNLTGGTPQKEVTSAMTESNVLRLSGLKALRVLNLQDNLSSLGLSVLAHLPRLETLRFDAANLQAKELSLLNGSQLKGLQLPSLSINDAASLRVLQTMPNLMALHLDKSSDATVINALPVLPRLQTFVMSESPCMSDELLVCLVERFPNLRRLDLWNCSGFKGERSEIFAKWGQLEDLGLAQTQVTDAGLSHISAMDHLLSLRLGQNRITDSTIPILSKFRRLEHVDISDTSLSDSGLRELATIRTLKTVKFRQDASIWKPATTFTDAGIAAFLKLRPDVQVVK